MAYSFAMFFNELFHQLFFPLIYPVLHITYPTNNKVFFVKAAIEESKRGRWMKHAWLCPWYAFVFLTPLSQTYHIRLSSIAIRLRTT
jgi:hypothetical protein